MKHIDKGDDVIPAVKFTPEDDEIQAQRRLASIPVAKERYEYKRAMAYIQDMSSVPREDFTATVMHRYIEALAMVGDFAQAYELSGEKIYNDIDKALIGKTKQCKCKGKKAVVMENGKPVQKTFPASFVKQVVFDQMGQRMVDLRCCNECGRLWI